MHLGLPSKSDEIAHSAPPASPSVFDNMGHVDLYAEGALDLSNIPPSGDIGVRSSLVRDFLLIQEKGKILLKASLEVMHRKLVDAQSSLLSVKAECDEYRRRQGVKEQWCGGLDASLLCSS